MAIDNVPVVQQQEGELHDVAICSGNKGSWNSCHSVTARSSTLLAAGGIVFLGVLVVVAIVTTTLMAQNEETTLKPAMTTPQPSGEYKGKCILVDRETRIVDAYKEEAASVNQFERDDSGCIVSVAGQEVIHLVGQDCNTAATVQCVAYPYADWCAHAEYKPFCLPQNECTNPFEFDSSLLSEKISFEKCENGVLTFTFNGTYSDDAPLVKYVDDGKIVIDASGTVKVINSAHFKPDRDSSDDPSIAYGKDVTLVILANVFCDDTKTTKYVCENLTEWQDELAIWRPWEYPCWIYPEIGEGKIATQVQVKELCEY